jgi:hypothetical protein
MHAVEDPLSRVDTLVYVYIFHRNIHVAIKINIKK